MEYIPRLIIRFVNSIITKWMKATGRYLYKIIENIANKIKHLKQNQTILAKKLLSVNEKIIKDSSYIKCQIRYLLSLSQNLSSQAKNRCYKRYRF